MEKTFDQLPNAVSQVYEKLENIERLLVQKSNESRQDSDRWFDLSDLCHYLPDKPTKATVYRWVSERKLPLHKNGKRLRFLKSEIDEWLRTGKVKTTIESANEASTFLKTKKKRGVDYAKT